MRKSSKVLAILFLLVAAGLVYGVTRKDDAEIEAAVEARIAPTLEERTRALEDDFAERQRSLEAALAERERALADTLDVHRQAIQKRVAALDSARMRMAQPVYFRIHADTVESVLRRMGLDFERGVDDQDDPTLTFRLATYKTTVYFYGCEVEGCLSLRIYSGFTMNEPPSVETINEWNRTKRYATAYLNKSGTAAIDHDLVFKGGVTLGALEAFILNFRERLGEFAKHIDF